MSLFQAREWWSYANDDHEADGGGSDAPSMPSLNPNGNNSTKEEDNILSSISVQVAGFPKGLAGTLGSDVVVLGTLGGLLKILDVVRAEDGGSSSAADRTWSASNLLLETQLDEPILQIAVGKLTSSS